MSSSLVLFACGQENPASPEMGGSTTGDVVDSTGPSLTTTITATEDSSGDPSQGETPPMMEEESSAAPPECGNGVVEGDEECDGTDFGGEDCVSQGFDLGELGCRDDCTFVHSNCAFAGCGNGIVEGTEVCDKGTGDETCVTQGFDSGTLACGQYCLSFDTSGCGVCGNGEIDGAEMCDGVEVGSESCTSLGFDSGTLSCSSDCTALDTTVCGTCGDGILDAEETCDTDQLGGQTCESLGLQGGTLGCSALCGYDVLACDIPGTPFGSDTGYSGYYFDPPSLPCEDISDTGTATGLTDDDAVEVAIGFTFTFYDSGFTNVSIASNGALHFGDASEIGLSNECLPSDNSPSDYNIYAVWDDLNPGAGSGEVYYETLGPAGDRVFIAQWDTDFYSNAGSDPIQVQVMLSEATGQITLCYADMDSAFATGEHGASATSGVQLDSSTALQYSCNTPDLITGRQIFYIPI